MLEKSFHFCGFPSFMWPQLAGSDGGFHMLCILLQSPQLLFFGVWNHPLIYDVSLVSETFGFQLVL